MTLQVYSKFNYSVIDFAAFIIRFPIDFLVSNKCCTTVPALFLEILGFTLLNYNKIQGLC